MIWHFMICQDKRDDHAGLEVAPLVTKETLPYVEYTKSLKELQRNAINEGGNNFGLVTSACIERK